MSYLMGKTLVSCSAWLVNLCSRYSHNNGNKKLIPQRGETWTKCDVCDVTSFRKESFEAVDFVWNHISRMQTYFYVHLIIKEISCWHFLRVLADVLIVTHREANCLHVAVCSFKLSCLFVFSQSCVSKSQISSWFCCDHFLYKVIHTRHFMLL